MILCLSLCAFAQTYDVPLQLPKSAQTRLIAYSQVINIPKCNLHGDESLQHLIRSNVQPFCSLEMVVICVITAIVYEIQIPSCLCHRFLSKIFHCQCDLASRMRINVESSLHFATILYRKLLMCIFVQQLVLFTVN